MRFVGDIGEQYRLVRLGLVQLEFSKLFEPIIDVNGLHGPLVHRWKHRFSNQPIDCMEDDLPSISWY